MTTKIDEAITIRMVEVTNKKEVCQTRDNPQTKVITEVVLQVEKKWW